MKILNTKSLIIIVISIGFIFTFFINGWSLLSGDDSVKLNYLNFYNRQQAEVFPSYFTALLNLTSILLIISSVLVVISLIRAEFTLNKAFTFLKWALYLAAIAIAIYGLTVRLISNHNAAANLYYYFSLIYLFLWYIEKQAVPAAGTLFSKIKFLPVYFILIYTMGSPGYDKIFKFSDIIGNYSKMFGNSFLGNLPGGIAPFIYFLGFIELAVPVLLIISLIKGEFLLHKTAVFLNWSFLIAIATFTFLCFGLTTLLGFPGATNLVLYALLTVGLYAYVNDSIKKIDSK